jgi:hypothetical protein
MVLWMLLVFFWDDAGFDYGVSQDRQKILVDYTRGKGLASFLNAWEATDVFAGVLLWI